MKTKLFSLSALAITAATGAVAQSTEYLSYGIGYTNFSGSGETADILSGNAALEYRFGDFIVSGGINAAYIDVEGESARLSTIDAKVGYFVLPDLAIYGGVQRVDIRLVDVSDNLTSYLLGGEYKLGDFTVGLNYSDSEDFDEGIFGIYGSYQMSNDLEVSLSIEDVRNDQVVTLGVDYDSGPFDVTAVVVNVDDNDNIFLINGRYEFGNRTRVSASYENLFGDIQFVTIGGGYEVANNIWLDASVGRGTVDDAPDVNTFGIGFTFETGRQTLLVDRLDRLQSSVFATTLGSF